MFVLPWFQRIILRFNKATVAAHTELPLKPLFSVYSDTFSWPACDLCLVHPYILKSNCLGIRLCQGLAYAICSDWMPGFPAALRSLKRHSGFCFSCDYMRFPNKWLSDEWNIIVSQSQTLLFISHDIQGDFWLWKSPT